MPNIPAKGAKGKGKTEAALTDRIKCLIEDEIKQQPYEFDGQMWAARSQQSWCDQLGISRATLGRVIKKPPFVRRRVQIDGRNVTLIRLGEDIKTARDYAKIMAKIWRDKTGRVVSRPEFGLICGLAEVWPEGQGPELLAMVLDRWSEFMAGVKAGEDSDRYYRYPSLPVIRRYHEVALEMLLMDLQAHHPEVALEMMHQAKSK